MAAEEEEEVQHNFTAEDGTTLSLRTSCLRRNAALLSSQRDLTGMSHWRAGSLLASLLACRNSSVLRGSAVCELGCGASALLASVAAAAGASAVVATDGEAAALPLAARNARRAAGGGGCAVAALPLRWGAPAADSAAAEAAVLGALGGAADLLLAAEVLYHHRGGAEGWGVEEQGRALLALAKRLLRPDGCLLLVYTPRYAGMAKGLRAAARGAGGVALRTIARHAALTPQLAASQAFPDTRILAASPCAAALQRWIARLGSPPEAPPADDSEGGEEGGEEAGGGHPLLAEVEGDLFA
jgi:predicted nicotinamide N-methyase